MAPLLLLALPAAPMLDLPALDAPTLAAHSSGPQRHTVADGETIFDLAQRYGTTVGALTAANGLSDPSLIRPGQELTIPSGTTGSGTAGTASAASGGGRYTVRSGDTLSDIAAAHGTSADALAAANGIPSYAFIHPGQTLAVPGMGTSATAAAKRPAATTGGYTVAAGDTLSDIAAATGSTVAAIAKASGISPDAYLQAGQKLSIPSRVARTESTSGATPEAVAWARTMPSRSEVRDLVAATAAAYGVDERLALAISWQESGWQQGVTSHAGAVGAMQVMPESGDWAGGLIGRDLDLREARDNVTAGVVILKQLTAMAKDRDEVIAAYYQGLGSVRERGWYADTRQYVANVNYFMTRI